MSTRDLSFFDPGVAELTDIVTDNVAVRHSVAANHLGLEALV